MDVRGLDNWNLGWLYQKPVTELFYRSQRLMAAKKRTRVREITSAGVRRRAEEDKTRESEAECKVEK